MEVALEVARKADVSFNLMRGLSIQNIGAPVIDCSRTSQGQRNLLECNLINHMQPIFFFDHSPKSALREAPKDVSCFIVFSSLPEQLQQFFEQLSSGQESL